MDKVFELCTRAVIQHLNGNIDRFNEYKDMALRFYHQHEDSRTYYYPIEAMIPNETKKRLYKMVS